MPNLFYKEESYKIIGICMDIHNQLGYGFLEIVYKDALEYELGKANIPYEREKEYDVKYKGITLGHKFYADFIINNSIILEIKASSCLLEDFVPQAINYLKVSGNRLALIVNFGESKFYYKRIVL